MPLEPPIMLQICERGTLPIVGPWDKGISLHDPVSNAAFFCDELKTNMRSSRGCLLAE
jgi:hypothetical protein